MKKNTLSGFTVLELLIVIAMMVLLMGMVLMGLNNARAHTRDQVRISNIKKIQIGIAQYYQICGNYPTVLIGTETCTGLSNQGKSLGNLIPDIASYSFNTGPDYKYVPLTYASGNTNCSGYHIGVTLEESSNALATKDSQENSSSLASLPAGVFYCGSSTTGFNGTGSNVYDVLVTY